MVPIERVTIVQCTIIEQEFLQVQVLLNSNPTMLEKGSFGTFSVVNQLRRTAQSVFH